jgi:acyl carrier protein
MEFSMKVEESVDLLSRLIGLVERSTNGRIIVSREHLGPDSLRRLGLDSLGMLTFLIAVEDEFGIEWGDDVPKEVLTSFESMAAYIARELGLAS